MAPDIFEQENTDSVNYVINLMSQSGDLYDVVRIVDPEARKVTEHRGEGAPTDLEPCHGFWNEDTSCKDCLAARAFRERRMMIRMEFTYGRIYMNTAVPVALEGRQVVVELLKNITESMVLPTGKKPDAQDAVQMLEQMNQRAFHDEETGAFNRRYIDGQLPGELERAKENRTPVSMILVGLDDMDGMAATYGQAMVDAVVRSTGEMLHNSMRSEQDWVARYSKDRFLILMRRTAKDAVALVAERLRARIERMEFLYQGVPVPATASLAVHTEDPVNPSFEPVLQKLEKKLYTAGLGIRNRVI